MVDEGWLRSVTTSPRNDHCEDDQPVGALQACHEEGSLREPGQGVTT